MGPWPGRFPQFLHFGLSLDIIGNVMGGRVFRQGYPMR